MPDQPLPDKADARLMLVLLDDPALLRAAVTWPRVPVSGSRKSWATLRPDVEAWARMARVSTSECREMFRALRDMGLIRVDGTVSPAVETVAAREMARRLGTAKK
jgi:hypothetical protein